MTWARRRGVTMPFVTAETRSRVPLGVWLVSGGAVSLLLLVSSRYGFHRDELYFVVAGRNLDWGYVDQPPLVPLIARASETLFGASPTSLRVLPALAVGLVAVLAALMARRFGGGRVGQVFAAATAGLTGVLLGEGHLLSTAVFDYALWATALWLVVLILDDADPRLWLAVGVVVGVGLENKHLIGFLALAILVGLLVTEQRRRLRSPWPWLGVAVAVLIALPNLIWQAANGWPQLEMAEALARRSEGPLMFVVLQFALLSVFLAIPAAMGWWWLARCESASRWRPVAIAYVLLFVVFLLIGAKAYYLAPMYSVLLAAGALWFEGLSRLGRRLMGGAAAVGIVTGTLIALPLMPPGSAGTFDATGELGETVGWPDLISDISAIHESIPAELRDHAVVLTGSYGEAAAVDVLGPDTDLPPAASGHNNYWLWGPPREHGPIIGVGYIEPTLKRICPDVDQVGTLGNTYGVANEVMGQPLWLCLEPTGQLADIWDSVRHFN